MLNNRVTESTGYSPFYLIYRYQPDFTILLERTNAPTADQRLKGLEAARKEAEAAL